MFVLRDFIIQVERRDLIQNEEVYKTELHLSEAELDGLWGSFLSVIPSLSVLHGAVTFLKHSQVESGFYQYPKGKGGSHSLACSTQFAAHGD